MNDLIFYDGTSYVNLVQSLKDHCGHLDIRHDVEAPAYTPGLLRLAELEARRGWQATYFLFPTMFDLYGKEFIEKGAKTGKHIPEGVVVGLPIDELDVFAKKPTSLHGTPSLYRQYPLPAASKAVWSYLEPWDVYISDSMGTWTAAINPGKIWEHELFEHPRRRGLPEAMVYCFRNRPGRVQLLVHGNPLAWREI